MGVRVGEQVPDVAATTADGSPVTLSQLVADGPAVIFFYPKAFTPTCTAEACHFRDLATEFTAVGATPIGVSRDTVDDQAAFGSKYELGFPCLADPDGQVAKAFGAKRPGPLWSKRQTYGVDTDRTLLAVIADEMDANKHADEALEVLRAR